MEDNIILSCDNLVKLYRTGETEVMALQGLELSVEEGEFMAVIGKSGSGKSTLLSILSGLQKPTAGSIAFRDIALEDMKAKELSDFRRKHLGFVWQDSRDNLLEYMNALDNVTLPLTLQGVARKKREERAVKLLREVGLEDRISSRVSQLSGGERQRVAIAVALITEPDILLLDEPTGALERASSMRLLELLRELNHERGLTIIMVTHDMSMADRVDRVVMISDGKISTVKILREEYRMMQEDTATLETHDEFSVLDKAGRLQLSEELRDRAGIAGKRVRVEVRGGEIVIKGE